MYTIKIGPFPHTNGVMRGRFYVARCYDYHTEYLHHDGRWHHTATFSGSWATEAQAALAVPNVSEALPIIKI